MLFSLLPHQHVFVYFPCFLAMVYLSATCLMILSFTLHCRKEKQAILMQLYFLCCMFVSILDQIASVCRSDFSSCLPSIFIYYRTILLQSALSTSSRKACVSSDSIHSPFHLKIYEEHCAYDPQEDTEHPEIQAAFQIQEFVSSRERLCLSKKNICFLKGTVTMCILPTSVHYIGEVRRENNNPNALINFQINFNIPLSPIADIKDPD